MRRACAVLIACLVNAPPVLADDPAPDFMEHWEFGITVDENAPPRYFADLILPLYRAPGDELVAFAEPRVSVRDHEGLYNLGWGVRRLVGDRSWLLGANMFYDYETTHSHYRLGWGLEALSSYAEVRANSYVPISQARLVDDAIGRAEVEEAVHGYDLEFGAPVPYYSRLKFFGGFNWYNFEKLKNRYGWTFRTEYTPVPWLVLDGLLSNDTTSNLDWGMTLALRLPLGGNVKKPVRSPLALDETPFPDSDAGEHLWRLVERHHEIVVERYVLTGTVTVEVARRN